MCDIKTANLAAVVLYHTSLLDRHYKYVYFSAFYMLGERVCNDSLLLLPLLLPQR